MSHPEQAKVLIIGSGPAGYTAAIYAARAGLNPILYKGTQPGGQLSITSDVENYPGFPEGVMGPEMMMMFEKQAARFGTDIRDGFIKQVDFTSYPLRVFDEQQREILCDSVIISTGAAAKWIGIPGEERLFGKGVSACAVCDGFFFRKQDVAVIGGGDSACEESSYLAKLCNKVYLIVRKDHMRASQVMQKRVRKTPNIELLLHTRPVEVLGESSVEGLIIEDTQTQAQRTLTIQGFFSSIGHKPNTEIFNNQLQMDDEGYIQTKSGSTNTNVEGVFATGDVQDRIYRQAITAAASGCQGALDAERFLAEIGK